MMTDAALARLAAAHPWPEECPNVAPRVHGWFGAEHAEFFSAYRQRDIRVVLELGTWLGMSARWFLKEFPNSIVICVDTWKGSREHHQNPSWSALLPRLWETFLASNWEHRRRIISIRATTLSGMREAHEFGVVPDLIYTDADHDYRAVANDLWSAQSLWPGSIHTGDDFDWPGVYQAVSEWSVRSGRVIRTNGTCWELKCP